MPMKWTPDNDQLLLLKILETHDLTVDTKKIAAAWPTDDGREGPTARAISERLVKIRANAKAGGAGHFAVKKPGNSKPNTPRKGRAIKAEGEDTPSTPNSKRKRATKTVPKEDTDDEYASYNIPGTETKWLADGLAHLNGSASYQVLRDQNDDDGDEMESPSKKTKSLVKMEPNVSNTDFGDENLLYTVPFGDMSTSS
ncbi:hypothetical protein L228DRAFT_173902 [Xylona heveae TC161]|uniref:Uncharacterized protein n=1 Tax=Xylona heveae (strain CBS 132557 / TC161) TaxID=1328760 RepID=A0A165AJ40_XYLHT|nr:hypothetical protein L228DRAFT_173902 [Xylona heveae TC161]KZF20562.1 hypothetical protein L228DRAFT_173902 [Xylona heveae TC161]